MDISDIVLYSNNIKYEPEEVLIVLKKETIKVDPSFVIELMMEKNFDTDYFPVTKLSMMLKVDVYKKIISEKDTVKIRLKLRKNLYDKNNKFIKYSIIFNDLFCFFTDDETPLMEKESLELARKVEGENSPTNYKEVYGFYLFKENEVTGCKKIVNEVISGSIVDMAAFLFNKVGTKKVLMTPPDNTSISNNVLIPALNVVQTFNYIEQKIGMYKKGMLLFFDYEHAYLIDKNYKCTAWKSNENKQTMIHIFNRNSQYTIANGSYVNQKEKTAILFTNTDSVKMNNNSIISNQLEGNKVVLITPSKNSNSTIIQGGSTRGDTNIKVIVNKDSNKYLVESEKTRLDEHNCTIQISFVDTDIETFTPNKEFVLKFEDLTINKKYGGKYRLASTLTIFKKDGKEFVSYTTCLLKRQEK